MFNKNLAKPFKQKCFDMFEISQRTSPSNTVRKGTMKIKQNKDGPDDVPFINFEDQGDQRFQDLLHL